METSFWYETIQKPFFAPPAEVFGIAWGILYPIIFVSFGFVFYWALKKKIPGNAVTPFVINIIANFLFSPIQFGLQSNFLAALDIVIVLGSLLWGMRVIWKHSKIISLVQIPYLLWILFATVLQFSITWMNL